MTTAEQRSLWRIIFVRWTSALNRRALIGLATGLCAIATVTAVIWLNTSDPDAAADRSEMQRSAAQFADIEKLLRSRFGDNHSRPELPPEGSPLSAYPSQDELTRYVLQIGYLFPATDEDVRWTLRVYRADFAMSVYALGTMPLFLPEGPPWYKRFEPQVSDALQQEVVTELVKAIMYPRQDLGYNQRELAVATVMPARLWQIPAIRDALRAVRNDPAIRKRRDLVLVYERMDRDLEKSSEGFNRP